MSGHLHRLALPLVVAVLVLGAGCTGIPGAPGTGEPTSTASETTTPSPTYSSPTTHPTPTTPATPTIGTPDESRETLEPLSSPWKPEPLRAGNVEVYVREYERTVRYNDAIEPSVTDVELTCQAWLVAEAESSYVLRAECAGSIYEQDEDGSTSVGAYAPEQVTYAVGDAFVQRIDGTDQEVDPYHADGENVTNPEHVAIANADDREHELRLSIQYDADGTNDTVLEERYNLTAEEGLNLESVAAREGTYNVTAELDGESVQYRWRVAPGDGGRPGGIGVVVTPDGDLLVIDLPRMR